MNATRIGGTWANWYDAMFKCGGFKAKDMFCVKELDDQFAQYQASFDRAERKQLAEDIQRTILENYYFVPVFRHAFVNAIGPRIAAQKWQDVFPTITTRLRLSVGGHQAQGVALATAVILTTGQQAMRQVHHPADAATR